jgi:hypothetical protein
MLEALNQLSRARSKKKPGAVMLQSSLFQDSSSKVDPMDEKKDLGEMVGTTKSILCRL